MMMMMIPLHSLLGPIGIRQIDDTHTHRERIDDDYVDELNFGSG